MIDSLATPEQQEAIKRMEGNIPSADIFKDVADSVLQTVPDVNEKGSWKHGYFGIVGRIGGCDSFTVENGMAPLDIDVSKIDYVGFYRQSVINKRTKEVKYFVASIPLGFSGKVNPGESIEVKRTIPFDWKREEVEEIATESFLRLQELVQEYYEAE